MYGWFYMAAFWTFHYFHATPLRWYSWHVIAKANSYVFYTMANKGIWIWIWKAHNASRHGALWAFRSAISTVFASFFLNIWQFGQFGVKKVLKVLKLSLYKCLDTQPNDYRSPTHSLAPTIVHVHFTTTLNVFPPWQRGWADTGICFVVIPSLKFSCCSFVPYWHGSTVLLLNYHTWSWF